MEIFTGFPSQIEFLPSLLILKKGQDTEIVADKC